MGFRRGLFLGLLVGLASAIVSGRPRGEPAAGSGGRSLLDEVREASQVEREATERRLALRFQRARETGKSPEPGE